jgi:hypothetical protein
MVIKTSGGTSHASQGPESQGGGASPRGLIGIWENHPKNMEVFWLMNHLVGG